MKMVIKEHYKKIILSLSILVTFCFVPFHNIYADDVVTISLSNIVDVIPIDRGDYGTTLVCILDNQYQGTVTLKVNYTYSNNGNTVSANVTGAFNVQGNVGYYDLAIPNFMRVETFSIQSQNLHSMSNTEYVYNLDYRDFIGYQYWELYGMSMSNINDIPCLYTNSFPQITTSTFNNSTPFIRMTEEPMYIAYFSNINDAQNTVSAIVGSSSTCTVSVERINNDLFTSYNVGGYVFNLFKFTITKPSDDYELVSWKDIYTVNWGQKVGNITEIIPIYYGNRSGMSNEMSLFLGFGDPYTNYLNDIYDELLEQGYTLDDIDLLLNNLRHYNVPTESIPAIMTCLSYHKEIKNYFDLNFYYPYPLFEIKSNYKVFDFLVYPENEQPDKNIIDVIYFISYYKKDGTTLNYFNPRTDYFTRISRKQLSFFNIDLDGVNNYMYLYHDKYQLTNSNIPRYFNADILNSSASNLSYFTPIYINYSNNDINISTDFALQYDLKNKIIQYIDIIANGTTQSNQSSSSLDSQSSQFDTDAHEMYTYENTFNNNMNSALQNIDTNFNIGNTFGSKFLASADWVRTQFNNLTSDNPFGTMLSFALLLGLAMLIIGKAL